MPRLTILSRDADAYADIIEQAALSGLELVGVHSDAAPTATLKRTEVLLADPDLAVPLLGEAPSLKWVQSTWAGVTPFVSHPRRGYKLTGIKDVFGKQMREYVIGYMLYYTRNVAGMQELQSKAKWSPPETGGLYGQTVAILGVGSIGREVARAAKAFDMYVIGVSQRNRDCRFVDEYISTDSLTRCAARFDFLVNLLPNTPHTENFIDEQLLAALPSHCVLINAGRGEVIKDQALINALSQGQIKAAVLDVFRCEPLSSESPLWAMPNVQITQHTAAISRPSDIAGIFIHNYTLYQSGSQLSYQVNFDKGY